MRRLFLRIIKSVLCPLGGQSTFSSLASHEASDTLQVTWVTPTLREDVLSPHPPPRVQSFICAPSALYLGGGDLRGADRSSSTRLPVWPDEEDLHALIRAASHPDQGAGRLVLWPSCLGVLGTRSQSPLPPGSWHTPRRVTLGPLAGVALSLMTECWPDFELQIAGPKKGEAGSPCLLRAVVTSCLSL